MAAGFPSWRGRLQPVVLTPAVSQILAATAASAGGSVVTAEAVSSIVLQAVASSAGLGTATGRQESLSFQLAVAFSAGIGTGIAGTQVQSLVPPISLEVYFPSEGWVNIAADLHALSAMEWDRGIRSSRLTDLVASTGQLRFVLLNHADPDTGRPLGYYSPRHANARTDWRQGLDCSLWMQDPTTGRWIAQFVGRIDSIRPDPGQYLSRKVEVRAVDWFDDAARADLTSAMIGEQLTVRMNEALDAVLATMTRQPTALDFDQGRETYPVALDDVRGKVSSVFQPLAASEFGRIYQRADGTLRAEGRHARVLNQTVAWTLDDDILPNRTDSLTAPSSRSEIVTVARVQTHDRQIDPVGVVRVLYQQSTAGELFVSTGQTVTFTVEWVDPVSGARVGATDVEPPVAYLDYVFVGADGSDQTPTFTVTVEPGGASGLVTLYNGGPDGRLIGLRIRARAIFDYGVREHENRADTDTLEDLGEVFGDLDMRYQANPDVGKMVALAIRTTHETPFDEVQEASVFGFSSDTVTHLLERDISDRLAVQETVTGVTVEAFINGVRKRLRPSGHLEATYTLAPARNAFGDTAWLLDVSTLDVDTSPYPF